MALQPQDLVIAEEDRAGTPTRAETPDVPGGAERISPQQWPEASPAPASMFKSSRTLGLNLLRTPQAGGAPVLRKGSERLNDMELGNSGYPPGRGSLSLDGVHLPMDAHPASSSPRDEAGTPRSAGPSSTNLLAGVGGAVGGAITGLAATLGLARGPAASTSGVSHHAACVSPFETDEAQAMNVPRAQRKHREHREKHKKAAVFASNWLKIDFNGTDTIIRVDRHKVRSGRLALGWRQRSLTRTRAVPTSPSC